MRKRSTWIAMIAVLGLAGAAQGRAVPEQDANRARDGDIAIMEELCSARRKATVEAYDLFIARHPDHPLAKIAREERARLSARRP